MLQRGSQWTAHKPESGIVVMNMHKANPRPPCLSSRRLRIVLIFVGIAKQLSVSPEGRSARVGRTSGLDGCGGDGDNPGSVELLIAIREALTANGIEIASPSAAAARAAA